MLGIHRVFAFVTTLSQSRASLDPAVGSADHLPSMLHDDLQLRIPRVSLDIRVPSTERFHFAAVALDVHLGGALGTRLVRVHTKNLESPVRPLDALTGRAVVRHLDDDVGLVLDRLRLGLGRRLWLGRGLWLIRRVGVGGGLALAHEDDFGHAHRGEWWRMRTRRGVRALTTPFRRFEKKFVVKQRRISADPRAREKAIRRRSVGLLSSWHVHDDRVLSHRSNRRAFCVV